MTNTLILRRFFCMLNTYGLENVFKMYADDSKVIAEVEDIKVAVRYS